MKDEKRTIGLREFSKDIGISAATLSRICNGGKADLDTAILVSRWLNKDLGEYILNEAT